ncbi:MAG: purine-nucleoside phosphorylase [Eubacteriales bacterium]|nr:purine-nucleoside phosphorylase [Eubacteriales bacterium]
MSTPHNEASVNSIAKTVIMPGDPKRSKWIAETFLKDAVLVNDVRGVQGYTGTWKDVPVTVMASGMGMPSIGIYSWELYNDYDVDNIIRVGSAGALQDDLKLMDIILAQGACTTSNYINNFGISGTFAPLADFRMLSRCTKAAKENGLKVHIGNVLSSDNFYSAFDRGDQENLEWKRLGILGVEMEAAALYTNAAYFGKHALCILTVSDQLIRQERLEAEKRQIGFSKMITLALDTAVKMEEYRQRLLCEDAQSASELEIPEE